MKRFLSVSLLVFFMLAVLFFSIAPANLDAKDAECTNKSSGDICIGECCKTTETGCIAGPCSYILKK